MTIKALTKLILNLKKEERKVIYKTEKGIEITATRTDKITKNDFAVGLVLPGRKEFYPTHIRLLVDLYIKRESDPKKFKKLYDALERVFNGENPAAAGKTVKDLVFPMQLDSGLVNLFYMQLLMVEQDINYGPGKKKTKFSPPRDFLMSFIRWIASGEAEIDGIIFTAVPPKFRAYPPPKKYWGETSRVGSSQAPLNLDL